MTETGRGTFDQLVGPDQFGVRREAERLKTIADQQAAAEKADRQYQKRKAWFSSPRRDGMVEFHATLHPEGVEYLRAAMDHLNRPEPSDLAEDERRTEPQRDADALVELARRQIAARGHRDLRPLGGEPGLPEELDTERAQTTGLSRGEEGPDVVRPG